MKTWKETFSEWVDDNDISDRLDKEIIDDLEVSIELCFNKLLDLYKKRGGELDEQEEELWRARNDYMQIL